MKASLRETNEDVSTVFQCGWEEPYLTLEDGLKTPKLNTKWTAKKKLSVFNAKALDSLQFCS